MAYQYVLISVFELTLDSLIYDCCVQTLMITLLYWSYKNVSFV